MVACHSLQDGDHSDEQELEINFYLVRISDSVTTTLLRFFQISNCGQHDILSYDGRSGQACF